MMNNLKIKISLGAFNVELEGDSDIVISQLNELKTNGLGQMIDQLIPIYVKNQSYSTNYEKSEKPLLNENNDTEQSIHFDENNITLQDIVLRMLPKSESEWVLVYGHFTCVGDKTTFTRDEIISKYEESKRKNANVIKNLTHSVKGAARQKWISALNDKEFMITPTGRAQLEEILSRQKATIKTPRKISKKELQ